MMVRRVIQPRWQVGIVDNSLAGIVKGEELRVRWIEHPNRYGWFGDPFVLEVTEKDIELLVEDYCLSDGKGRITKLTIDRPSMTVKGRKVLLDGGHYSFPAILKHEGRVYVYPEQKRQGCLQLYEYDEHAETLLYVETLSNEPWSDAILYDGMVYYTTEPDPNGKRLLTKPTPNPALRRKAPLNAPSSRLALKGRASSNIEPETLNQPKTIVFDECIARNAGDFFEVDGVTYRPAQECNRWYGNALSIQKFENGAFTEVRRIPGMHTLNSFQGVTVVDRKAFPFQWVYWLLRRSDK